MEPKRIPYHKKYGLKRYMLYLTPEMREKLSGAAMIEGRTVQMWLIRRLAILLKMDPEKELARLKQAQFKT